MNKKLKILIILLVGVFVSGCASIKFKHYRSDEVFEGKGGSIEVLNGVEIWEDGTPNAKYKIIGVIDYKARDAFIQNRYKDKRISKLALEYDADGIILMNDELLDMGTYSKTDSKTNTDGTIKTNPYLPGYTEKSTSSSTGMSTIVRDKVQKYYVFKYVE